jgi:hypothetical protein
MSLCLFPSLAPAQDKKQDTDPAAVQSLQKKIDNLTKELKELKAKQAKLKVEAEEEARIIIAQAEAQAVQIKAAAKVEAAKILNEAHAKDPELFVFLKKVEAMKMLLGDQKTILLIPAKSELFKMFVEPPQQEKTPKKSLQGKDGPAKGSAKKENRAEEFNLIWQAEFTDMLKKMSAEGRIKILLDPDDGQGLDLLVPNPATPKK